MSKVKVLTVNEVATLFGLDTYDTLDDDSMDYRYEVGQSAYEEALKRGMDEDAAEQAREYAEEEISRDLFYQWHGAVLKAADHLFDAHGMKLVPVRPRDRYCTQFKILPTTTWKNAANEVRKTINGVGEFYYASVRAFCDAMPDTPRGTALTHLHWLVEYPRVYGTTTARSMYERAFR